MAKSVAAGMDYLSTVGFVHRVSQSVHCIFSHAEGSLSIGSFLAFLCALVQC